MSTYLPISAVAEALAVDERRVRGWIKTGELAAIDVGPARGKHRRWRISQEALEMFLARRSATPPVTTAKRRRQRDPQILHFDYS